MNLLSDYIGLDLPNNNTEEEEKEEENEEQLTVSINNTKIDYEKTPFLDEQTYNFYKSLPNLREILPSYFSKKVEDKTENKKVEIIEKPVNSKGSLDDAIKQLDVVERDIGSKDNEPQPTEKVTTIINSEKIEIESSAQNAAELFMNLIELKTSDDVDRVLYYI